jgi:hypothetical protein
MSTYYYEKILKTIPEFDIDRRERVIKKMNNMQLECKTQIYIVPNFGLGDLMLMNGAIRYYATLYDTVIVICPIDKIVNIKLFFRDDINIRLENSLHLGEQIINDFGGQPFLLCAFHKSFKAGRGLWVDYNDVTIIPDCYYHDLKLDPQIRIEYFYFQPTIESELLYNLTKPYKYIFIHNMASESALDTKFLFDKKSSHLLINCSMNMYTKDEIEYALAERFINRHVIHYSKVIENADEIHVIDSSINVFVQHLDLSSVKVKKIYIRGNREYGKFIQPDFEQIRI